MQADARVDCTGYKRTHRHTQTLNTMPACQHTQKKRSGTCTCPPHLTPTTHTLHSRNKHAHTHTHTHECTHACTHQLAHTCTHACMHAYCTTVQAWSPPARPPACAHARMPARTASASWQWRVIFVCLLCLSLPLCLCPPLPAESRLSRLPGHSRCLRLSLLSGHVWACARLRPPALLFLK